MWVGSFRCCNVDVVTSLNLTLKAPITTAADDIHEYCFNVVFFSEKIRLDVLSESSARQRIHTKNQAVFSSKHKMSSAIFLWRFKG